VDLDWEAPGLSYMFSKEVLPPDYPIQNDAFAGKTSWSSIELLNAIAGAVRSDAELRKAISANDGIPSSDKEYDQIMKALKGRILVEKEPIGLQILTPASGSEGDPASMGRIHLLPANPISDISAAFVAMRFDIGTFITGLQDKGKPRVTGDSLLRLFVLFLINRFDLDYLLIDCRAGMTPLGYMASSRLSDIVLVPTTTYNQALYGAKTLVQLLELPSHNETSIGPPYGPEKVLLFFSNVFDGGWRIDKKGAARIFGEMSDRVDNVLGRDSATSTKRSEIVLPHVNRLSYREGFITSSNVSPDDPAESLYIHGIERLAEQIERVFGAKVEGQFSLTPTEATFSPHALDSLLEVEGSLTIRVLVEEGAFGERPFTELIEKSQIAQGLRGRLNIVPIPIKHDELLDFVKGKEKDRKFDQLKSIDKITELPDLVSFPHYMLGKLAQSKWILPLTFLDNPDLGPSPSLDFSYLHDHFYLADELCLHAGTPFAFPFSVLRKLLLIKNGFEDEFGADYEREYGETLDLNRAGWRVIQRSLKIAKANTGKSPLILENEFKLVGVWYDWLEFVFAFGGTDFARRQDRGSDYGECRLNNIATIDGTFAYLNLFWQEIARSKDGQTWYTPLEKFFSDPTAWMTVMWSDIVTSNWDEVRSHCLSLPFPSALPTPPETIVEGWVMGVPYGLKDNKERLRAVKSFLQWFLSEQVQAEFARVGGNPSRKLPSEQLPDVLRMVHETLAIPKSTGSLEPKVAPKITFPEAPEVIGAICKELEEMVGWPEERQRKQEVAYAMDKLAGRISMQILDGKSVYVPLSR
jgi:ABC-type glycerol-3-phosphate transport system substrate-binding protein